MEKRRKKILWCGDAAVASGFAKITHEVLKSFVGNWDIFVLGMNYAGDPHNFPYPIYPTTPGGDYWGLGRVVGLVEGHQPDIFLVLNDPWNVPAYMKKAGNVLKVASMPVDGKNCKGSDLNGLNMAIFWTDFAEQEAREGGYTGPSTVIPLGVDLKIYKPIDRKLARKNVQLPEKCQDAFIVGNINRNQTRKRIDLTISIFAEWVKTHDIQDAYLYLHVSPSADIGYDCNQLAKYFGLAGRVILQSPSHGQGIPEFAMANSYNCFDVQITTTQGEGWGLCTMEGMACGVPQIVPDWAALGEWPGDAAVSIPCSEISVTPRGINAIGGVPDRARFIEVLNDFYNLSSLRKKFGEDGLALVSRPEFRWEAISQRYDEVLNGVIRELKGLQPIE